MTPSAWIAQFLDKRNLNKPDGRPLFAYKATADEYRELINVLRTHNIHGTAHFSQVWLLYAAEWWKREYAGSVWRWQPIFESIGRLDITHAETKDLVTSGHFQWKLQTPIRSGGRRFIGVVVINGGLPLRLLEMAHGRVTNLLKSALRQVIKYRLASDQLREQITSQANLLPVTYQQEPIFDLLEDVGQTVLHLRDQHQLSSEENPVAKLDADCPGWQALFPISLEGDAARSMIRELIGTTNEQSFGTPFQFIRGLRFSSDGNAPTFDASFEALATIQAEQLQESLGVESDQLPANFQILLCARERQTLVAEVFRRGQYFQVIKRHTSLGAYATEGVELKISRWGSTLFTVDLPNGDEFETDEPLVFEDTEPFARFIARGDASVKGYSALVLLPPDVNLDKPFNGHLHTVEQRTLIRLSEGEHSVYCGDEKYSVRISPIQTPSPETYWVGKTIEAISKPGPIFLGKPRLKLHDSHGNLSYVPAHEIVIKTRDGEQPLQQVLAPGLCRVLVRRNGQRLVNVRCVVLAENASISYKSGKDAFEGTIYFHNWPLVSVSSATPGVIVTSAIKNQTLELHVTCSLSKPVDTVALNLLWPTGKQKLTLPFPTDRVTIFKESNILESGTTLALDELVGCRALLPSGEMNELWRIRLSTLTVRSIKLSQEISYWGAREIRLFELRPAIEQLLSCYSGIDHEVRLEIFNQQNNTFSLRIGRYSAWLTADYNQKTVVLQRSLQHEIVNDSEAEELVQALPWSDLWCEPVTLPHNRSENACTGQWEINLPNNTKGSWILYTPKKQIRPTVLSGRALIKLNASPLERALCQSDTALRMACLHEALQAMAENLNSSDWDLLDNFLNRLGHLPLSSLDVSRALIVEPNALTLAAICLGDFSNELIERLPAEMPFEWLLIGPSYWFNALQTVYEQVRSNDATHVELTRQAIERRTSVLARWQPAMRFIFEQGFHIIFGKRTQDVSLFFKNPPALVAVKLDALFKGQENSRMQQLFHRHPVDQHNPYPVLDQSDLSEFVSTEFGQLLFQRTGLRRDSYQLSVVLLPFMVASDAYHANFEYWQGNTKRLFTLRIARLFDDIWFEEAYETGLVMLCAKDLQEKRDASSKRLHQQIDRKALDQRVSRGTKSP